MCVEDIDRTKSVLVDSHSLRAIAPVLSLEEVPTISNRDLVDTPGGPWLANILQAVVLHDTLLVDSLLLELEPDVVRAQELFPDVIKGLFIREDARERAGKRACDSVLNQAHRAPVISNANWVLLQWLDSSEKPLLDRINATAPKVIPPVYASDRELMLKLDRAKPIWGPIPAIALDSAMTLGRAHFYLELARELNTPLNIDPIRSEYLRKILDIEKGHKKRQGPQEVVNIFIDKIAEFGKGDPVFIDVDIPPVANYVLAYAQHHRISLRAAALEIRDSEHARSFRNWCAQLFALKEKGTIAYSALRPMMAELENTCNKWAKGDTLLGVRYDKRKLNFGELPLVGWFVKFFGGLEREYNDKLMGAEANKPFIFLNDLLRPPSKRVV